MYLLKDTRFASCEFSVPSGEVVKLGKKYGDRFGFKCTETDVFFTTDGLRFVKVNTCAATNNYPPGYAKNEVKSGAYHRRYLEQEQLEAVKYLGANNNLFVGILTFWQKSLPCVRQLIIMLKCIHRVCLQSASSFQIDQKN